MYDTYLESLESPVSCFATQILHISRMSDQKQCDSESKP